MVVTALLYSTSMKPQWAPLLSSTPMVNTVIQSYSHKIAGHSQPVQIAYNSATEGNTFASWSDLLIAER